VAATEGAADGAAGGAADGAADGAAGAGEVAAPQGVVAPDRSVLAPLAERYLTGRARAIPPEDPDQLRAMPVVLRLERADPPGRTAVLEAAAAAALAVCLDPRAAPGGEWHAEVAAWMGGRIRKLSRRARGAHWTAVTGLPGETVEVDGAQVRALVPTLVPATPREVARLQIGGTDLPADDPGEPPPGVPVVWLSPEVEQTVGKAAAQVGHATMLLAAALPADRLARWRQDGLRCAVRVASAEVWARLRADADRGAAVAVRDAGFTEVAPGTITCIARP
jgi:peptidyl-tRNA hydrolase